MNYFFNNFRKFYDYILTENDNLSYDEWYDKTQNIPNILVQKKNFLSKKDINFLLKYYKNNKNSISKDTGDLYLQDDISNKYYNKLIKIANDNGLHEVYKDTMIISNTRYNTAVGQHYDNCKIDNNGKIIRNHSAFRTFTATVSLTNDFTGGELYITKSRNDKKFIKIKEELGEAISFTSNIDHKHYVTPLKSGERFRLLIWLHYKPSIFRLNKNIYIIILILIIIIYALYKFIRI